MVAKVISGKSLLGALNYNEHKVSKGSAVLIGESGYLSRPCDLTFREKINRLTSLADLNRRVRTNTVHISLSFAVGEHLAPEMLNDIAQDYMCRIGFENQPYLVYQHFDAAHPHMHIVTTNITATGSRISLHNIGKTKSETARKAIELQHGLVQAASGQSIDSRDRLSKAVYSQGETKRTITNIVNAVVKTYKCTSIPELNAVLNHFNVAADRGSKASRMYAKNGLIYWILNERGEKVGVPIKASSIYGKPTLKNLEDSFRKNEQLRRPQKERLKKQLDSVLVTRVSQAGFQQALAAKGIQVLLRRNEQGRLYGVTYVDHLSRVVFNGSDLGKVYSAAGLASRFVNHHTSKGQALPSANLRVTHGPLGHKPVSETPSSDEVVVSAAVLADLFRMDYDGIAPELLKRKKKKRRQV